MWRQNVKYHFFLNMKLKNITYLLIYEIHFPQFAIINDMQHFTPHNVGYIKSYIICTFHDATTFHWYDFGTERQISTIANVWYNFAIQSLKSSHNLVWPHSIITIYCSIYLRKCTWSAILAYHSECFSRMLKLHE